MMKESYNEADRKWLVIAIIIFLFLLFLIIKINGYMDFSGRFGIEYITCKDRFPNNRVMMIDGDTGTTWGLDEYHQPGEEILFRFRKNERISRFRLINESSETTVPVCLFFSSDGNTWEECKETWLQSEHCLELGFNPEYDIRFIKLVFAGKNEGYWPITEVQFYE